MIHEIRKITISNADAWQITVNHGTSKAQKLTYSNKEDAYRYFDALPNNKTDLTGETRVERWLDI